MCLKASYGDAASKDIPSVDLQPDHHTYTSSQCGNSSYHWVNAYGKQQLRRGYNLHRSWDPVWSGHLATKTGTQTKIVSK